MERMREELARIRVKSEESGLRTMSNTLVFVKAKQRLEKFVKSLFVSRR